MAWTVILEDERGEKLQTLNKWFAFNYSDNVEYKLLKYLDPYGNTIFNPLQIRDLIDDLNKLKSIESNPQIDEIIKMAIICSNEVHTYLVFYGD